MDKERFLQELEKNNGNVTKTFKLLKLSNGNLNYWKKTDKKFESEYYKIRNKYNYDVYIGQRVTKEQYVNYKKMGRADFIRKVLSNPKNFKYE